MPDDLTRRPLAIALAAHRDERDGRAGGCHRDARQWCPRSSRMLGDGAMLSLRFMLEALTQPVGIETSWPDGRRPRQMSSTGDGSRRERPS